MVLERGAGRRESHAVELRERPVPAVDGSGVGARARDGNDMLRYRGPGLADDDDLSIFAADASYKCPYRFASPATSYLVPRNSALGLSPMG